MTTTTRHQAQFQRLFVGVQFTSNQHRYTKRDEQTATSSDGQAHKFQPTDLCVVDNPQCIDTTRRIIRKW